MSMIWKNGWGGIGIVLAALLGAAGCGRGDAGAAIGDLLVDEGLDSLDEGEWSAAEPGCEGLLDGGERFAIASAEDGLVAALDAEGHVLCVDTVEAVEEELEESGRQDEADRLVTAYHATLAMSREGRASRFERPCYEGDPDPEPNIVHDRFRLRGDPDPEPNTGA